MSELVKEVSDLANQLISEDDSITFFEALQIAVKIQHNRVFQDAFLVGGHEEPSALEAIAMELGAKDGSSLKDAIYRLKED